MINLKGYMKETYKKTVEFAQDEEMLNELKELIPKDKYLTQISISSLMLRMIYEIVTDNANFDVSSKVLAVEYLLEAAGATKESSNNIISVDFTNSNYKN